MPDTSGFGGNFGAGMMFVGAISSAVGSHDAAASQKLMLGAQAQMDRLNAQSSSMAMNGQADLELINAKAGFEAMSFNSTMNMAGVKENVFNQTAGAQLNELNSSTQAGMTLTAAYSHAALGTLQASAQSDALEVGAHIAEQNAAFLELQAQSTLLHGQYAEQNSDLQYAQAKSRATVQMGRGNIDMSEGSGLMTKVGIDVMSQRAAIMIQQDTLMQAFGQRQQASNMTVDAGLKRAQAATVMAMGKINADTDIKMGDIQAGSIMQQAHLKTALTAMNSEFEVTTAQAQSDWTASMVSAGLLNAEAGAKYKHTMAKVMLDNASAASMIKSTMADGISPTNAFISSALGSAGQVANAWYSNNRTTTAPAATGT
jgi:hypothetical protein